MKAYDTLKLNKEFRRLYGRGKSSVSPVLVVYAAKTGRNCCRIGVTTGKKIGNAVKRNRCRRIILAAWRTIFPELSGSYDIVFVARGKTPFVKSTEVEKQMRRQLKTVGILFKDKL